MGYITWRLSKIFTKQNNRKIYDFITALIFFTSCIWGAIAVYGIGTICHTWPFPWAGITYASVYLIYVCMGGCIAFIGLVEGMDEWMLTLPYAIIYVFAALGLFGQAIVWWPS